MHQFNEHHPELKGFSEYFHREVFPVLESREAERLGAVKRAERLSLAIVMIAVVCLGFAGYQQASLRAIIYIIGGGVLGVFTMYAWQLNSVTKFAKQKIVSSICKYVGWKFNDKPVGKPDLTVWNRLHLIPNGYEAARFLSGHMVTWEDQFYGKAHGAEFYSFEAKLTRRRGKSTVTDFHGQLMTMTFPRKFAGRTIVLRDKGRFQRKAKSDMKRVGLVDPVFEKIFEAYGTDQVEARYLLTPTFMQRLVDLEQSIQGKNIRFGFFDSQLFIAVETGNRYEAGSMLKSMLDPTRTQRLLDEIGAIYDVIDGVTERSPAR